MITLYLDLETIPAQRADVLADIQADMQVKLQAAIDAVKPPSNYGEEARIKWGHEKGEPQIQALMDAHQAEVDAAYRKTGLDGAFGQVFAIGYAVDNATAGALVVTDLTPSEEAALLADFFARLDQLIPAREHLQTCVVGHHVAGFDLRFLAQRSIVQGIRPHTIVRRAATAKPWESEVIYDTMTQWAGVGQRISLDKLCRALGIASPKGELDGSKVWDFVKAGRTQEVADYCAADVEAVRAVHRRMTFQLHPVRAFMGDEADLPF